MEIDDIPDLKRKKINQYPERVTIAVSSETKEKLEFLRTKNKNAAELCRRAIDEVLEQINFE